MREFRKRVSVVVRHENKILGFHAEDPVGGQRYFFVPGGAPEEGETLIQAACREVVEETGYNIEVFADPHLCRRYDFEWNGKIYDCETHYYLGQLRSLSAAEVDDANYHRGVDWVPIDEAASTFSYHADIVEPIQCILGETLEHAEGIEFCRNRWLTPGEISTLYRESGIRRPHQDFERLGRMYENSNLVISAWDKGRLIGVSRALTDFSYCCYLSDLAVTKEYQSQGIGRKLVQWTETLAGPQSMLLLLSAPEAMDYYPRLDFERVENGFIIKRRI